MTFRVFYEEFNSLVSIRLLFIVTNSGVSLNVEYGLFSVIFTNNKNKKIGKLALS